MDGVCVLHPEESLHVSKEARAILLATHSPLGLFFVFLLLMETQIGTKMISFSFYSTANAGHVAPDPCPASSTQAG